MSPLEFFALCLGYAVMVAGGICAMAFVLWQAIEFTMKRARLTKHFLQWYFDSLRSGKIKP